MSDPTPEQIRQRAAKIRAKWSDSDFARRAGRNPAASMPGTSGLCVGVRHPRVELGHDG